MGVESDMESTDSCPDLVSSNSEDEFFNEPWKERKAKDYAEVCDWLSAVHHRLLLEHTQKGLLRLLSPSLFDSSYRHPKLDCWARSHGLNYSALRDYRWISVVELLEEAYWLVMFHLHSRLFAADLLNLYQELDSIRNFSNASSALEKSPELAKVRFKLHWGKNSLDEQALSYLLACWEVADTFTQLFLHGQDLSKDLKIADVNNDALRTFCRRAREKVMKKDLKGAVDVCTEATSHFPFTFFPYQNRSVCYMMLGDFNAAAADVKRALLLHPQWSQGFELLARALHRCGWSQLALRLTRLALYKVKSKGLDPTDLSLQEKKLGTETESFSMSLDDNGAPGEEAMAMRQVE
uniref:uncharacterized protein n=1 Tax=Myxine glutinosa TaxID=7769 RepID=UPI00358EA781